MHRTRSMRTWAVCLPLAFSWSVEGEEIIQVPDDFPTIQAAIDAAENGDEIIVADGTYTGEGNQDIDFLGKTITVRSENGPDACIIDCEEQDRAFHFRNQETSDAVLEGFTITNGIARRGIDEFGGGAIACTGGSDPTIANCRLTGNQSVNDGGGAVFCQDSDPRIIECEMTLNTSNGGGAVICIASSPSILNCEIVENRAIAGTGGGISLGAQSSPLIKGCTIARNEANAGGGMRCLDSDPTIDDCTIRENVASTGGGVSTENSSPAITRCVLEGNRTTSGRGAAIHSVGGGPSVTDCRFSNNRAEEESGGGIVLVNGDAEIVGCTFEGNTAGAAGAVETLGDATPIIVNSVFHANDTPGAGGAIANNQGAVMTIIGCLFTNNTSDLEGGAIANTDGATLIVLNSTFFGNSSPDQTGGAIRSRNSNATASNCVFWNNSSQVDGGVTVTYSNIQGGREGEGNIDADPLLVDPDNGDYRLGEGSPSIDAANNAAVPEGVVTDLDGNPRFVDDPDTEDTGVGKCQIVDMGSYEFQTGGGCCVRIPAWVCDGDVDGDGQVNPVDSGIVQAHFGSQEGLALCNYDVDCDGQINPVDAGIVQSLFGTCESPRDACP